MSTLLSTDMHIKRSTTKVHAPPGGQTSISLNSWEQHTPSKPKKEDNKVVKPAAAEKVEKEEVVEESKAEPEVVYPATNFNVALVVLDGPAADVFIRATQKTLTTFGVVRFTVTKVPYLNLLVRSAQKLLGETDGVIVEGVVASKDSAVVSSITASLFQLGIQTQKAVIAGLIVSDDELEGKALAAAESEDFGKQAAASLDIQTPEVVAMAPASAHTKPIPPISEVTDTEELLNRFRETLKARGASGIFGLQRKFKIIDDDNSKSISLAEFTKAIGEHALSWSPEQISSVFNFFDSDRSGSISFDEFIVGVRGTLNERRQQLVLQAFEIMDADKSGVLDLSDVKAKYNGKKHPDVIAGRRTEDEILKEFLDTFDQGEKDGKVTPQEFCKYYANLSASIDEDDYFELMIRNAWHISGGEGWCANSTCRRVLVTHADGRQTVEEIKNDLGLDAKDKDGMIARLKEQGITDITGIDLFGAADNTTPATKAAPANSRPQTAPAATQNNRRRAPGGAASIVLG